MKLIEDLLEQVASEYASQNQLDISTISIRDLVTSKDPAQGDFSSNLAFKLSRLAKKSPGAVASELLPFFKSKAPASLSKIEIAGAGFINFFLSRASLNQILLKVREQNEAFGRSDFGKLKKVCVEFVSANPTGPLTIAHGRQAALGDTLVRILRAAGYAPHAEYYLNDAGRQMNLLGKSLWARYRQALGQEYPLPEDGYQGAYLIEIAQRLKTEKNDSLTKLPEDEAIRLCRSYAESAIMAVILEDLNTVDVHFDQIFRESSLYQDRAIEGAFKDLESRGFLYQSEGALWFRSTEFGDDKDRVVRKATGELTYIAPDIAYHRGKFQRGFEWIVDFMGPDHHGYVARLKAACAALGHDPKQIEVRIVQLTTLYRNGEVVRMSTRAGEFVTLKELVDEVGKDAARFFFLMRKVESHLDFDLELAKQKSQDNPVYYLQYAHARISSILRNAPQKIQDDANIELLIQHEEIELIKRIYDYPNSILSAAETLEPYRIVDYLRELAAAFHKFYSQHRVLADEPALAQARLTLVDAVRIVLRNGLSLLGVSKPETM